jgi:acetyl-CoA carboxylase carboxyl transferase subunit alpha
MENPNFYLPHEKQIYDYMKTIEHLKRQNQDNPLFTNEIKKLEQKVELLKKEVYGKLTPWERVLICRHPQRPHTVDYIKNITDRFVELAGDRLYADDRSVIGGFAEIGGIKCMLIGQEKGSDTESRVKHNFGMLNPEGFRKALRLMKLAEKFRIPIVTFLDTPGAHPGLEAEERGQGWAIAANLKEMSRITTPIITVVIGEGCSGGALGIGVGDTIGMLEHAYYSVISPEGCASILWKDAGRKQDAAAILKLNAEPLLELGLIDEIIPEPLGGAHHDPKLVYDKIKQFIVDKAELLKIIPGNLLIEQRYNKFRAMGKFLG